MSHRIASALAAVAENIFTYLRLLWFYAIIIIIYDIIMWKIKNKWQKTAFIQKIRDMLYSLCFCLQLCFTSFSFFAFISLISFSPMAIRVSNKFSTRSISLARSTGQMFYLDPHQCVYIYMFYCIVRWCRHTIVISYILVHAIANGHIQTNEWRKNKRANKQTMKNVIFAPLLHEYGNTQRGERKIIVNREWRELKERCAN